MKYSLKATLLILLLHLSILVIQAQERTNIKTLILYQLHNIDGVYIPQDINDSFKEIDKILTDSLKQEFKEMSEYEFSANAHFGLGMWMRNNWGFWRGSRLSKYLSELGIFHPDDMSDIIVCSYHRYLNGKEIELEEQIAYYKDYWEKVEAEDKTPVKKKASKKERKKLMPEYKKGRTVYYGYPYGFSTEQEEDYCTANDCYATGKMIDIDFDKQLIKVRLTKCCNPEGVILYDSHYQAEYYDSDEVIEPGERRIFYMKEGDEFWFSYREDYWEWE